jgi:hypothetical protein
MAKGYWFAQEAKNVQRAGQQEHACRDDCQEHMLEQQREVEKTS